MRKGMFGAETPRPKDSKLGRASETPNPRKKVRRPWIIEVI